MAFLFGLIYRTDFRHCHSSYACQLAHRFDKIKTICFAKIANGIPAYPASKTMIKSLIIIYVKRRCFLAVKRTKPYESRPFFRKFHPLADNTRKANMASKIFKKCRRDSHKKCDNFCELFAKL